MADTIKVFFYGLFMDEEVLRGRGVHPQAPRKAVVSGYRLRIGRRAMLQPEFGSQAFGMMFTLTDREIKSLYAGPGLENYRPEPVIAFLQDGTLCAVTMFNLPAALAAGEPDLEYAESLRAVFERLGFPADSISSAVEGSR